MALTDRRAARIVRACRDLPGQHLFQFVGPGGEPAAITSTDVNAYLHAETGTDITAKDFRTWGGTLLAVTPAAYGEKSAPVRGRSRQIIAWQAAKMAPRDGVTGLVGQNETARLGPGGSEVRSTVWIS